MNPLASGHIHDRLRAHTNAKPSSVYDVHALRENLIRRMRIVAKARFAANKRLEAKAAATNFGLQTSNLYTIGIGILLLQYPDAAIIQAHERSLNYISLVASVFVQIIALIETYKDYSGKARSMHECAVEVNRICQQLELDPRIEPAVLAQYQTTYSDAIKDFDVNHDDIDFLTAQLEPTRHKARNWAEHFAVMSWRMRYLWNVYAFTVSILLLPWLCYYPLSYVELW